MLELGRIVEKYRIESVIGTGGMAVVYRVTHVQLGSAHALKVLAVASRGVKERLLQEGQVQAQLRHPNIVAVTDVIDVDGHPGLVMELVQGPSLDALLRRDPPLTLGEVERLFRGIALAVGFAHARGVVHRDLKPANVLLEPVDQFFIPKVADFGLAKAAAGEQNMDATRSGIAMGTPAYMAPEQIRNAKHVDHRADMFSLGCMLYEMVCGQSPFAGPDILSIFNAVAAGRFTPPRSIVPGVPPTLHNAIESLLKVDVDERLSSCSELLELLGDGSSIGLAAPRAMAPSRDTWFPESPVLSNGGGVHVAAIATPDSTPVFSAPRSESPPELDTSSSLVLDSLPAAESSRSPSLLLLVTVGLGAAATAGVAVVVLVLAAFGLFFGETVLTQKTIEARAAAWAEHHTGGELTFRKVSARRDAILLDDVRVDGRDGHPVLEAGSVELKMNLDGITKTSASIQAVNFYDLSIELRRDGRGWILPEKTLETLHGKGSGLSLSIDEIDLGPAFIHVPDPAGDLRATWSEAVFRSVTSSPNTDFSIAETTLRHFTLDGRDPIVHFERLELANGARATLEEADVWVRLDETGRPTLPGPLRGFAPPHFGGTASLEGAGLLGVRWPRQLAELKIASGLIFILDASDGQLRQWQVELEHGRIGPSEGDEVPIILQAREAPVAEGSWGRIDLDGYQTDGNFVGLLNFSRVPLESLESRVAPTLEPRGLRLAGGRVDGTVELAVEKTYVAAKADLEIRELDLAPLSLDDRAARRLENKLESAGGKSRRGRRTIERQGAGDLTEGHPATHLLFEWIGESILKTRTTASPTPTPPKAPEAEAPIEEKRVRQRLGSGRAILRWCEAKPGRCPKEAIERLKGAP